MEYPNAAWAELVADISELEDALSDMHARRAIWREYRERLKHAPAEEVSNSFHDWIVRNYAEASVAAFRRLVDDDAGTHSLSSLLQRVERSAAEITLRRYSSLWKQLGGPNDMKMVKRSFVRLTESEEVLAPEVPRRDRNELKARTRKLEQWAHSRIAHTSRKAPEPVTFEDLDSAHDLLEDVLKKYCELLKGVAPIQYEPAIADPYWKSLKRLFDIR